MLKRDGELASIFTSLFIALARYTSTDISGWRPSGHLNLNMMHTSPPTTFSAIAIPLAYAMRPDKFWIRRVSIALQPYV